MIEGDRDETVGTAPLAESTLAVGDRVPVHLPEHFASLGFRCERVGVVKRLGNATGPLVVVVE